jgi:hypothetical protein
VLVKSVTGLGSLTAGLADRDNHQAIRRYSPSHSSRPPTSHQTACSSTTDQRRWPDGAILPGHWTARVTDAAHARAARRFVAQRHGQAGATLLRPGEGVLTTQRIIDYGQMVRPRPA